MLRPFGPYQNGPRLGKEWEQRGHPNIINIQFFRFILLQQELENYS